MSPKCPVVTKREELINRKRNRFITSKKTNFTPSDNYFSGKQRLFILLKFPPKPPSFQTALLMAPPVIRGERKCYKSNSLREFPPKC